MVRSRSGRKHPQPKLILDENLAPRERYKKSNRLFNLKHIEHDYHKKESPDEEIYTIAQSENRIIVTSDKYDFRRIRKKRKDFDKNSPTIIAVSMRLNPKDSDKKLVSCVQGMKPSDYKNKIFKINDY